MRGNTFGVRERGRRKPKDELCTCAKLCIAKRRDLISHVNYLFTNMCPVVVSRVENIEKSKQLVNIL